MEKSYKPGQFVSIGRKLAKVCKSNNEYAACFDCRNENNVPCWTRACIHANECLKKLGPIYYPKFIKIYNNEKL